MRCFSPNLQAAWKQSAPRHTGKTLRGHLFRISAKITNQQNSVGCRPTEQDLRDDILLFAAFGAETFSCQPPCETCSESYAVLPAAQQHFQLRFPFSGASTSPGSFSSSFCSKEKSLGEDAGCSAAAQLLFCSRRTCQLINCASRGCARRRIRSAYQHRSPVV